MNEKVVRLIDNLFKNFQHYKNFKKFYPNGKFAVWDSAFVQIPRLRILFIGEAPGPQETLQGIPFVGRSGKLLRKFLLWLTDRNISWAVTNAVPFMPVNDIGKFEAPSKEEIELWRPYLKQFIIAEPYDIIIALGTTAVEALIGQRISPTKAAGEILGEVEGVKVTVFPHPSYFLRNGMIWESYINLFDKVLRNG